MTDIIGNSVPDSFPAQTETPANAESFDGPNTFLRRVTATCAIVSLFVVGFLLMAFAADVLILTFAAVWFGVVIRYASLWLVKHLHLPSTHWATALVVVTLLLLMAGFGLLLGLQIADEITSLYTNLVKSFHHLQQRLERYPQLQKLLDQAPSPQQAMQGLSGGLSIRSILLSPIGLIINLLFIFFTGLYLATNAELYRDGLIRLFPVSQRQAMRTVLNSSATKLWQWTIARLASMAIIGTLAGIGYYFLGLPMAITLGCLTGLLTFIPNVGPFIALVPPLLLATSIGGNLPLYTILVSMGIELVESYLITPIIHQKEDNLPAAIVIVSQLLFGLLFGLLGVTFAMPIALVAMVFVHQLYIRRGLEGKPVEAVE